MFSQTKNAFLPSVVGISSQCIMPILKVCRLCIQFTNISHSVLWVFFFSPLVLFHLLLFHIFQLTLWRGWGSNQWWQWWWWLLMHSAKLQLNISTLVSLEKLALISGINPDSRPLSLIGQENECFFPTQKKIQSKRITKTWVSPKMRFFSTPAFKRKKKKWRSQTTQVKTGRKKNKAEEESKKKVIHHCSSKFEKKGKKTANLRRWASRECRRCIQREQKSKPPTSTCASSTDSTNNPNL